MTVADFKYILKSLAESADAGCGNNCALNPPMPYKVGDIYEETDAEGNVRKFEVLRIEWHDEHHDMVFVRLVAGKVEGGGSVIE